MENAGCISQLIEEFISRASSEGAVLQNKGIDEQRELAERFLLARKEDVPRAVRLYLANEKLRREEGLEDIDPRREPIREELLSGKFTILTTPDHRTGAIVAIFTLRLHWPEVSVERDTLQGLTLQLDTAMQCANARRNGVILVYDMQGCKVSNFDYKLSTKIVRMLQGSYPARLRSVFIVTAPLWFRAPFKLLRLFLREKLRQRVFTITCRTDLTKYLSNVPSDFGGSQWHSHREWLHNHVLLRWLPLLSEDYFTKPLTAHSHPPNERIQGTADDDECSSIVDNGGDGVDASPLPQLSSSDLPDDSNTPTSKKKPLGDTISLTSVDDSTSDAYQHSPVGSFIDDSAIQEPSSPPCSMDDESSTCSLTTSWDSEALNGLGDSDSVTSTKKLFPAVSVHQADDLDGSVDLVGFLEHIRMLDGSYGLMREFTSQIRLRDDVLYAHTAYPAFERNPQRNRYLNVPCVEATRVVLHLMANSDYIHANWVDGYQQRNAFICAQGPMTSTIVEFWSMIWEYHVPVIVMTTKPWEQRVDKCAVYWPEEEGKCSSSLIVNNDIHLVIRNETVQHTPGFRVSTLIVQNTLTGESRKVIHLYFTAWADHSAPESADAFLDLLEAYRLHYDSALQDLGYPPVWQAITSGCAGFGSLNGSHSKSSSSAFPTPSSIAQNTADTRSDSMLRSMDNPPPPTVVHCSAGIGRTGTFVAMDVNTKRLDHTGRVSLLSSIQLMRTQRRGSVQTDHQYIFLHSALLEYAKRKGLLMETSSDEEECEEDVDEEDLVEEVDESEENAESDHEDDECMEEDLVDQTEFDAKDLVPISMETPSSIFMETGDTSDIPQTEQFYEQLLEPASSVLVLDDTNPSLTLPPDDTPTPSVPNGLTLDLERLSDSKQTESDSMTKSSSLETPGSTQEELVFPSDIVNISEFTSCHTSINTKTQPIAPELAFSYADVASL